MGGEVNKTLIATNRKRITTKFWWYLVFILVSFSVFLPKAGAATLSVGPSAGTFTVGSTFDVSLYLDTQGKSVNAIGILMSFSPDKLQLVSPFTGKSIIEIWTAAPKFNNQTGKIELLGGIPGGINVSNGLITTLTFRVKSVGPAVLKFLDDSKVLLNDGLGTDDLNNTTNGVYQLTLPPPAGPIVASQTHPNQSVWYSGPNAILEWAPDENAQGYSYILNKEPVDLIDNISEGQKTSVIYKNLGDSIHYFHIKALREGVWGGITHFAIQVDTAPPADFPINIIPSAKTTRRQPVVEFQSSDSFSGIDHYEIKILPLKINGQTVKKDSQKGEQPLFIEAQSPHILSPLELGTYDVIIRAYDKAGNYREGTKHLSIVNTVFQFIGGKGIEIRNIVFIPWGWFWAGAALVLLVLIYGAWWIKRWHREVEFKEKYKALPQDVKKQLEELQRYKSKYGPKALMILFIFGASLLVSHFVAAQQVHLPGQVTGQVELTPPLINTISRNISNEEIFYVGGKTEAAQSQVILYLQNLQTGETVSHAVTSDKNGDWFYRHDRFLLSGNYLLWAQGRVADQLSPPGPQFQMTVRQTALQFGSSRLSYETLYLIIVIVLLLVLAALISYIIYHGYHGRKKHLRFMKEVREAQESVRRGFAVLRRDIQAEFNLIKKLKLEKVFSEEERAKEEQLLKDLQEVEQYLGKEIWDIEESEYNK